MTSPLRIAIVAQAWDCVPSRTDDAASLGIKHLADALVARGHTVLLCAVGPSHSDARVVVTMDQPGTELRGSWEALLTHVTGAIAATIKFQPDVIHDFTGVMPIIADSDLNDIPYVITIGEPLSFWRRNLIQQTVVKSLNNRAETAFVADTKWMEESFPSIPWTTAIPHAVSVHDCTFGTKKHPFALHIGPLEPLHRPFDVVKAAKQMHLPITIASHMFDANSQAFYANHLAGRDDIAIINRHDALMARKLLSQAQVLITTDVAHSREPHWLTRALASGTPVVVAHPADFSPEFADNSAVIEIDSARLNELQLSDVLAIDAYECRRLAARDYSLTSAAYERIYEQVIGTKAKPPARNLAPAHRSDHSRKLRAS